MLVIALLRSGGVPADHETDDEVHLTVAWIEHDFAVRSDVYIPVVDVAAADQALDAIFKESRSMLLRDGALVRHVQALMWVEDVGELKAVGLPARFWLTTRPMLDPGQR